MKKVLLIWLFYSVLFIPNLIYSQDYNEYIDPNWDNYYNKYPSGIESNFSGSDFIKVIDYVNFVPTLSTIKGDTNMLKKVLLSFQFEVLRQMMITGNFYSRSRKHDDYFNLYIVYYSKIDKATWDRYCPYLIPLMEIDGIIKLH